MVFEGNLSFFTIPWISSSLATLGWSPKYTLKEGLATTYAHFLRDVAGKTYTGYSNNLRQRLRNHTYKDVQTTSAYEEPKLIWYCAFISKKKALDFEKYLKVGSGHAFAKKHLI